MDIATRKKLALGKAKLENLVFGRGGFFTKYKFVDSLKPVSEVYPSVEQLCAQAPYAEFVAEMASHIETLRHVPGLDWDARMLSPLDGTAAYAAARKFRPKRIIEIGSGQSTRFLAAGAEGAEIICIDPLPWRSVDDLPVTFIPRLLQNEDAELCDSLEPNDILFIDSSHIMLPGMDVDIEFNRIFPRLKPGVLVHVHDIFLPFDYPPHWRDRNWNEQNALVGWLFGSFEIVYPGHYVVKRHPELIDRLFSDFAPCLRKLAGSMWLRKL
jgi:predicted O-methyltransferase YrrM